MAEVTIPQSDAAALASPSVCAKTGAQTIRTAKQRLVHTPVWIWILLLFGIFPLLVVYYFTRKVLDVEIPISDELARRRFRFRLRTVVVLVVSLALAIVGAYRGESLATIAGVTGLVGVVALGPIIGARMWITARYDGESIKLSQLDPSYVAQLDSARSRSAN